MATSISNRSDIINSVTVTVSSHHTHLNGCKFTVGPDNSATTVVSCTPHDIQNLFESLVFTEATCKLRTRPCCLPAKRTIDLTQRGGSYTMKVTFAPGAKIPSLKQVMGNRVGNEYGFNAVPIK